MRRPWRPRDRGGAGGVAGEPQDDGQAPAANGSIDLPRCGEARSSRRLRRRGGSGGFRPPEHSHNGGFIWAGGTCVEQLRQRIQVFSEPVQVRARVQNSVRTSGKVSARGGAGMGRMADCERGRREKKKKTENSVFFRTGSSSCTSSEFRSNERESVGSRRGRDGTHGTPAGTCAICLLVVRSMQFGTPARESLSQTKATIMDLATIPANTMTIEELEQELLQLPHDVRSRLADVLTRSVEDDVEVQQNAEARRRYEAYLRGEIEAYDLDEALENLRKKILG